VGQIPAQQWSHITLTWNGTSEKVYVNGKQVASYSVSTTNLTPTTFYIGSRLNATQTWKGGIDQFKIYGYARTSAQVALDYNRGGPLAWYNLDECQGTSAKDNSGRGSNATITIGSGAGTGHVDSVGTCATASTAWGNGATGKINYSLSFDGIDDYIVGTDLDPFDDFSATAWFKTSASGSIQRIVDKDGGGSNDYWTVYMTSTGTIQTDLRNGAGATTNVTTTKTFNDGNWHHLAYVRSGTNIYLYVDGLVAASGTKTAFTFNNAVSLGIGNASSPVGGQYFKGQIDDVRVYNYALTPVQVIGVKNNGALSFSPATGAP
jgi:hypothetical protein